MGNDAILERLNADWPASVATLRGVAVAFSESDETLDMEFEAVEMFCHSGDVVQGGYITGMLDAVMAYSVIGIPDVCKMVATLEIKVNFMSAGRPGPMLAKGRVIHRGRSIAFLAGELYQKNRLIATATSTVKLLK